MPSRLRTIVRERVKNFVFLYFALNSLNPIERAFALQLSR